MSLLLKLFATVASLLATLLAIHETLRRGIFVVSFIFGLAKLLVFLLFCGLLLLITYLLVASRPSPPSN